MATYISEAEAKAMVPQPTGGATSTKITQALTDTDIEVNDYLLKIGIKTVPLTSTDATSTDFKLACAYWCAGILMRTHSNPDEGDEWIKKAKAKIDTYKAVHSFIAGQDVLPDQAGPSTYQYADRGDFNGTDLMRPFEV